MDTSVAKTKPDRIDEGCTLFLRNVSFDADETELTDLFCKFGRVEYAKIVKDPLTQHSKGTAFVKFFSQEVCRKTLAESLQPRNTSKFMLHGRLLCVTMAVSRDEANKLRKVTSANLECEEGVSTNKAANIYSVLQTVPGAPTENLHLTGRNLALAAVGMIRPGTPAAEGLTQEDFAKRETLLKTKKAKLKNPQMFVSRFRLTIHNLPVQVSDYDLRQKCRQLVKGATITECRIMRDLTPGPRQNRSLGYAFVAFDDHKDALNCLNAMNNNPDVFGPKKRPIVEFSIENMAALDKKQRRAEKSWNAVQNRANQGGATTNSVRNKSKSQKASPSSDKGNKPSLLAAAGFKRQKLNKQTRKKLLASLSAQKDGAGSVGKLAAGHLGPIKLGKAGKVKAKQLTASGVAAKPASGKKSTAAIPTGLPKHFGMKRRHREGISHKATVAGAKKTKKTAISK